MKSLPSLQHISIATSGAAGGTAQADQHLPHPRSPQISSHLSSPAECGPRIQASAISLPNSLSTALPAPVTLSLHLLPKPHACSSRAADVLKQVFLPSRPLLLSSLSLQLILSPPFLSVGILPDFPGLSGSTPRFPSYCIVLPALPLMVPRPHRASYRINTHLHQLLQID